MSDPTITPENDTAEVCRMTLWHPEPHHCGLPAVEGPGVIPLCQGHRDDPTWLPDDALPPEPADEPADETAEAPA